MPLAPGLNQKAPQRIVAKTKKPKTKKDGKKDGEEQEAEKKTILKDEKVEEKEATTKENG